MNDIALPLLTACLAVPLVFALRRVPEGTVYTLHRRGRYVRTLTPGWHLTLPFIDRIAHRVNLVGHHVELATDTACPAGAVYYQILEPERAGQALDDVDTLVRRQASEHFAVLAADDANLEPAALATRLKDELNRQLNRLGLLVIRCQLNLPTSIR